ncbi:MAG: hypothetical protein IKG92_01230 [Bacteroidales bacterium]|nr:hypothetical protein [Bacteroidales bacterium]
MKRILSVLLLTFALAWAAGAQRVNAEIGLYYQNGQYDTVKDNFIGASILVQFEPFFPASLYLSTGIEASLGLSKGGNVPDYRFELPVKLSWLYEPSPKFSVGPYAGVYGVANLMVTPDDKSLYNTLQGGFSAGLTIQFGALDLYGGYWRDFLPFRKGGSTFSGFRITLGIFL